MAASTIGGQPEPTRSLEQRTMRRIYLRVLPLAALIYLLCYLDRINVGFAALTMNKALGLDSATYGFAAGLFYWGYFLFEVPSNLILERVGARLWIARIMVSWGVLSGATAFCVGPWTGGLYALAGFSLMSAIVAAFWLDIPRAAPVEVVAGVAAE